MAVRKAKRTAKNPQLLLIKETINPVKATRAIVLTCSKTSNRLDTKNCEYMDSITYS